MTSHEASDRVLGWLDAHDVASLAAAEPSTMAAALTVLMVSTERDYPRIDEDRLATYSRLLRSAGHGGLDRAVVAWLGARPSTGRLDIASVILQYFWRQAFGQPVIDPSLVEALLEARNKVVLTPESDASSLFALVASLDAQLPSAIRERVLDVLANALTRPHTNPAVQPVLAQALAKAGRNV